MWHQRLGDPTANQFLPLRSTFERQLSRLTPLPPLDATTAEFTYPPEAFPGESIESFLPQELVDANALYEDCVTDTKDSFFQKLSFSVGWIDRNKADGYGVTEMDLFSTFAVPLPTRDWPLLLTPAFNLRHLDGPATIDASG